MPNQTDITRWIKRQLRGVGSLLAAALIVGGVMAFAIFTLITPSTTQRLEDGRLTELADGVGAAVASVQGTLPSLYINTLVKRPIAFTAQIETHGWKNRGQRIIDTRIAKVRPVEDSVEIGRQASVYPAGQITEQLRGQRVLASVSEEAATQIPENGTAKVSLVVTPSGQTATLVIDSVISPRPVGAPKRSPFAAGPVAKTTSGAPISSAATKLRVSSLSRYWGAPGTKVTMTGAGFGKTQGTSWVTCAGSKAHVYSWSDTKITFRIPKAMTKQGYIGVAKGKTVSNGLYFSPYSQPTVKSISPQDGAPGSIVTLTGSNFGSKQADGWVTFSGATAQVTSWSSTKISVIVPRDAGSGYAGVVAHGMTSNGVLYGPLGAPLVSSVSAHVLLPDRDVTIRGRSFGTRQGKVVVGGVRITPTYWTQTEVRFTVPHGLPSGYAGVIRADSWTSNGRWASYAPRLERVLVEGESRWWAAPGDEVTLEGVDFGTTQGTRRVFIGGAVASVVSWSPSAIVARVPFGTQGGYVGVGTSSACSNGIYLVVRAQIESVAPTTVDGGGLITITGTGFGLRAGSGSVLLDGSQACEIVEWSDTRIVVRVPASFSGEALLGVRRDSVDSNGKLLRSRAGM